MFGKCLLIATLILATAAQAQDDPDKRLADARAILTSDQKDGRVVRWKYAPVVVIVHDNQENLNEAATVVREIENVTGLKIRLQSFRIRKDHDHGKLWLDFSSLNRSYVLYIENELGMFGQNFIFVVNRDIGSKFLLASRSAEDIPEYARQFARGEFPCFFQTRSSEGNLYYAFTMIDSQFKDVKECIYEEIMQTFGLINDAEGSEIFTFDDTPKARDRTQDHLLLKALYDDSIAPGDPIENVLKIYEKISATE